VSLSLKSTSFLLTIALSIANLQGASELGSLPDSRLTPGATLAVTKDDVCTPGYSRKVRAVPVLVKRKVFHAYGINHPEPRAYEVDHLISLELGGSNSIRNLWPEQYYSLVWNAHVKDSLENRLHSMVCSGEISLETAQREISGNWIAAYKKYFDKDVPVSKQYVRRHRQSGGY
jgi:hypothetical protein